MGYGRIISEFSQCARRGQRSAFRDLAFSIELQCFGRIEEGLIDVVAEQARLEKELTKAEGDIKRADAKLSNEKFVANAAEEVVEEEREKRAAAEARKAKVLEAIERLKVMS
ncbi:MAG: hypothetical protein IKD61_08440 [Oscillospiraceae bacterium]|nr:hypothetical protein [Oscillospiraceae bacterium]